MAQKQRDAVSYMLTHTTHEAGLIYGRFVMFWSGGSPHPIDDFVASHSSWFLFVLAFNICVALGTLAGVVILFRRGDAYAFPLAAGPVVFPFAYYLTLALPRYRHPIDPTLLLLTAVSILSITKASIAQRPKSPAARPRKR
jgi:hypothetical protein